MKKKLLALGLVSVLAISLFAGCSKPAEAPAPAETPAETPAEAKYADGIYFAQEDGFAENGWKYMVTVEVKDGAIASAVWNGANKNAGPDKITLSTDGTYGMVAKGGAQAEWHEQAAATEAYLLEKQDPTMIEYTDAEGHTDAIAGVSIHVIEYFTLVEKALAAGPVGAGQYKDGAYHAESAEFDANSGWKSTVDLTVINGYIVAANWDGIHKDGGDTKKVQSADGRYDMSVAGAKAPWHEQAAATEAVLLESQDPAAVELNAEGKTDAIAGVSISVGDFFTLAAEALATAK